MVMMIDDDDYDDDINRGYYMAAQTYEISLRMLKNICERVKYFFNPRREISYLQAAMQYSIYYINQ